MAAPPPVYLDHAAATPPDPEVAAAVAAVQRDAFANPSSQHALGRRARQVLEESRERILAAVGAAGRGAARDRLVFTSGASEANALAICGLAAACPAAGLVLWSRRDHPSSTAAAAAVAARGWRRMELALEPSCGTAGSAAVAAIAGREPGAPCIVSLTLACGQTGSIEDVSGLPRADGLLVHADATQAAATMPLEFHASAAATLTLAPHKFGGPRGIGGLVVRAGIRLEPLRPGPQEQGLRGGTEAVALAAGFAVAVEIAVRSRDEAARRIAGLRDQFAERIVAAARDAGIAAEPIAAGCHRVPHIATIAFPGIDRQAFVMAADLAGVCLATGTACSSGSSEPAPALLAMGLPTGLVRGAVRFSFGRTTTQEDVDRGLERLAPVLASCRGGSR